MTHTFGDWAKLAIETHFQKVLKHEAGVLADKDPEELHQMRVGMRRLRTAMSGFAPAINLPPEAQEKQVAKVARQLGKLRDLDVLKDLLKDLQTTLDETEQTTLKAAFDTLDKKRQSVVQTVQKKLYQDRYLDLKAGLQQWLTQPQYQKVGAMTIEVSLPDLLLPQISQLLLHPGWLVGSRLENGKIYLLDRLNQVEVASRLDVYGDVLHSLRKAAKKARYQMELFTQFYADSYADNLHQIKQLQSVLGKIQDCFVLKAFLDQVFTDSLSQKLPTFSAHLNQVRYEQWGQWQQLQRFFLDLETRQQLRQTILDY